MLEGNKPRVVKCNKWPLRWETLVIKHGTNKNTAEFGCHQILQLNNFTYNMHTTRPKELNLLKSTGNSSNTTDLNTLRRVWTSASLLIPQILNSYNSSSLSKKLGFILNKTKTPHRQHCGPHNFNTLVAPFTGPLTRNTEAKHNIVTAERNHAVLPLYLHQYHRSAQGVQVKQTQTNKNFYLLQHNKIHTMMKWVIHKAKKKLPITGWPRVRKTKIHTCPGDLSRASKHNHPTHGVSTDPSWARLRNAKSNFVSPARTKILPT
jgi:hypothetical protein